MLCDNSVRCRYKKGLGDADQRSQTLIAVTGRLQNDKCPMAMMMQIELYVAESAMHDQRALVLGGGRGPFHLKSGIT